MTAEATPRASSAIAGFVLAGGASSRFGSDKSQAEIGGMTMLHRMLDLVRTVCGDIRVVAASAKQDNNGVVAVPDRWPGEGPLGGIITALLTSADSGTVEWNLILGCDMPFLTADWLAYLTARAAASPAQVIAPESENGLEPLCAIWRTSAAAKLQITFDTGVRKITTAMKRLQMEVIDEREWKRFDTAGRLFWNMNTVADYEEAKRILESDRT